MLVPPVIARFTSEPRLTLPPLIFVALLVPDDMPRFPDIAILRLFAARMEESANRPVLFPAIIVKFVSDAKVTLPPLILVRLFIPDVIMRFPEMPRFRLLVALIIASPDCPA